MTSGRAHDDHPFRDAAVQAEYDTGVHEATEAAARSHIIVRLIRMSLGFVVMALGVVMLAAPGPGTLAIAAGLVILAPDVAWADRALRYLRRRVPGIPEDGRMPRSTLVTGVALGLAGLLVALWFGSR